MSNPDPLAEQLAKAKAEVDRQAAEHARKRLAKATDAEITRKVKAAAAKVKAHEPAAEEPVWATRQDLIAVADLAERAPESDLRREALADFRSRVAGQRRWPVNVKLDTPLTASLDKVLGLALLTLERDKSTAGPAVRSGDEYAKAVRSGRVGVEIRAFNPDGTMITREA